jgi:hypothetical protein
LRPWLLTPGHRDDPPGGAGGVRRGAGAGRASPPAFTTLGAEATGAHVGAISTRRTLPPSAAKRMRLRVAARCIVLASRCCHFRRDSSSLARSSASSRSALAVNEYSCCMRTLCGGTCGGATSWAGSPAPAGRSPRSSSSTRRASFSAPRDADDASCFIGTLTLGLDPTPAATTSTRDSLVAGVLEHGTID